jgi:flagellin
VARENFQGAESGIRDIDVAAESAELARNQVLQQAGAAILAQANLQPRLVLDLLRD